MKPAENHGLYRLTSKNFGLNSRSAERRTACTYSAMAPTPQTPDAVDPDVTVNFQILKVIEVIDYLHRAYASHGSIGCIIFQSLMQQDWTGHDAPYAAALPAPYAAALPAPYEVALPGYPA